MEPDLLSKEDLLNLLGYWNVLKKRKRVIAALILVVTSITVLVSLLQPKFYKAEAVIMPIGKSGGGGLSALAAQFGGLASLGGLGGGAQTPSQQFMALLGTRTLAEEMIKKYDLVPVLSGPKNKNPKMGAVVQSLLSSYVQFVDDKKTGLIRVSAEFRDPKLAADVANGYVEELQRMINDNSFTVAKRNRVFIEKQLEQNKMELLQAGKGLNEFYRGGKVSSVESTLDVPLAMSDQQSSGNDLEVLQKQKEELDSKLVVKNVPQQVYLQYLTLRRDLLTQINTLLTQQYEMAKIEEAKDELAFQVIDPARVPETRSKPKRTRMVFLAFVFSSFCGIFGALLAEYAEKLKKQMRDA